MDGNVKQVIFRYDATEHPLLDEWISNQSNRTQSIIHGLERTVIETGVDEDLVKHTLTRSLNTKKSKKRGDA